MARRWRQAAALCLLTAALIGAATWYWQSAAASREAAAAARVGAEVTARVDDSTVRVRTTGGDVYDVTVVSAADHPRGQHMTLTVDDDGLHQPVSDPYDVTAWLALAVVVAGMGLGCWSRGNDRTRDLRALFSHPQPVTQVYVRAGWGVAAVYPGDARPGEAAVTELRCLAGAAFDADLPAGDGMGEGAGDDGGDAAALMLPTRPALLYGLPIGGHWCVLVVDGRPMPPTAPVPVEAHAPPFTEPTPGGGLEPISAEAADGRSGVDPAFAAPGRGDLPLRPEEIEAIDPSDRDDNPYQTHSHAPAQLVGYAVVAAAPLLLTTVARLLPALSALVSVIVAAPLTAVSCVLGWRLFLRTRIVWNRGGVAVVGAVGVGRFAWRDVYRIERGRSDVTIRTVEGGLVVAAHEHSGALGGTAGIRSGWPTRCGTPKSTPIRRPTRPADRTEAARAALRGRCGRGTATGLGPAHGQRELTTAVSAGQERGRLAAVRAVAVDDDEPAVAHVDHVTFGDRGRPGQPPAVEPRAVARTEVAEHPPAVDVRHERVPARHRDVV